MKQMKASSMEEDLHDLKLRFELLGMGWGVG
jgi:hypothetical protein